MTPQHPTFADELADELAGIRAEIARLKQRETALASIEHAFPVVPVFRRTGAVRLHDRAITAHA